MSSFVATSREKIISWSWFPACHQDKIASGAPWPRMQPEVNYGPAMEQEHAYWLEN